MSKRRRERLDLAPVHYSSEEYQKEYLRSAEWLELRAKVLPPGGRPCVKCNSRPATQVHHTKYRHIVDVKASDLIPLCDSCHRLIHKAVRLRMMPKTHDVKFVFALDLDRVRRVVAFDKKRTEIPKSLLCMLNANRYGRLAQQARGILRCLPPRDWMVLEGTKFSGRQVRQLHRLFGMGCDGMEKRPMKTICKRYRDIGHCMPKWPAPYNPATPTASSVPAA